MNPIRNLYIQDYEMIPVSLSSTRHRFSFRCSICLIGQIGLALSLLVPQWSLAAAPQSDTEVQTPEPDEPTVAEANNDGQNAISNIKFAGLQCELFAAEPDVANIIAFQRDYSGRLFVCETFRQDKGIEDNRGHTYWMDEELAAQTVQDRIDYILKYHPEAAKDYTRFDDRVRVLRDTDGDGKADTSTVFANRFNSIESGSGAGVLSYRDKVYYTNIPALFELTDSDGDDVSDTRKKLQDGYGVHFAFRGHDMHGLIVGPDGRLYFSIGDRGYNLPVQGVKNVDSGSVLRCELDGSNLEVFATGLRNPQELAFDDYGNLFTGDNNSDSGDMARWVYLVQGGDSGWRFYYQYLDDRGPFNREKIWHANETDVPAYIIPPIENLSDGPSGLEYYPGTGFSEDFKGRFFLCDFRGGPTNSGIRSFRNEADGAFFNVVDQEQPIWGVLPTDIDFGSDGKLYLSDWVLGWVGEDRGRIYTFFDEKESQSDIVKEVESLLKNGLKGMGTETLVELAGHADQRIRQEAQFELVAQAEMKTLIELATRGESELARIHGIWGMAQLGRMQRGTDALGTDESTLKSTLETLLADELPEIRVQAVKAVGDLRLELGESVKTMLADSNARVRFHAAMTAGQIGPVEVLADVAKMLVNNDDKDPIVRHGGIMAMRGLANKFGVDKAIVPLLKISDRSVRVAAAVALRELYQDGLFQTDAPDQSAQLKIADALGELLTDDDQDVALEAIRAITDLPVLSHMHLVAALPIASSDASEHLDHRIRRIINANNHLGTAEAAMTLAKFAADSSQPEERRVDAVKLLGDWMSPSNRDYVSGAWRPIDKSKRKLADAQVVLSSVFKGLIKGSKLMTETSIEAASALELSEIGDAMAMIVTNEDADQSTRVAALRSLGQLKDPGLPALLEKLGGNFDALPRVLAAVTAEQTAATSPAVAVGLLEKSLQGIDAPTELEGDELLEKQIALQTLGKMSDDDSAKTLKSAMQSLVDEKLPASIRLDAVMASQQRDDAVLKSLLEVHDAALKKSGVPTDEYADVLFGGDVEKGAKVFWYKTEVSCVRCHRIGGTGGKVGPYLSAIGKTKDRRYILEAIVEPSKKIAVGHAQMVVLTDEGLIYTGVVKEDSETQMALMDADGNVTRLDKDTIEETKEGKSGMPNDLHKALTMTELRDLVAFLADQKDWDGLPEEEKTGHGGE